MMDVHVDGGCHCHHADAVLRKRANDGVERLDLATFDVLIDPVAKQPAQLVISAV
jgi:hypothetical protein